MNKFMYSCVYLRMYAFVCVHVHIYMHAYILTHDEVSFLIMQTRIYIIHTYTHTHTHIYRHTYTCTTKDVRSLKLCLFCRTKSYAEQTRSLIEEGRRTDM